MIEIIKIFLVEDHDIVRDGIKALLLGEEKFKIVGEAPNATIFFNKLKNTQADVIVLDIALPGMSGIEIAKILQKEFPQLKTLFLSANTHENHVISAVKAGALGFLPKTSTKKEFLDAVFAVYHDQFYFGKNISNAIFQTFANTLQGKKADPIQELSDREMQALQCFAEGLTYKETAQKLNITTRTVESHKKSIFEKLQFHNNVDLVKYAIKQGLIDLD